MLKDFPIMDSKVNNSRFIEGMREEILITGILIRIIGY